jgi:hypothetical protein
MQIIAGCVLMAEEARRWGSAATKPHCLAESALAGLLREALEKFVVDRVKSAIAEDDDDVA